MLMSVIVYMYTVIAFNFFRKFYSKEEEGEIEENCQDLFTVDISKDLINYTIISFINFLKINL